MAKVQEHESEKNQMKDEIMHQRSVEAAKMQAGMKHHEKEMHKKMQQEMESQVAYYKNELDATKDDLIAQKMAADVLKLEKKEMKEKMNEIEMKAISKGKYDTPTVGDLIGGDVYMHQLEIASNEQGLEMWLQDSLYICRTQYRAVQSSWSALNSRYLAIAFPGCALESLNGIRHDEKWDCQDNIKLKYYKVFCI